MLEVEKAKDITKNEDHQFRNYSDSQFQDRVRQLYYENHTKQTLSFVISQKTEIGKLQKKKMTVMDAAWLLNEIVDNSDPDTDLPQIIHLLQTAEAIRQEYPGEEYDWFHLTGFIHDLGKVLSHPNLFDEPQWAVVGDTFPVGCQYSDKVVFREFFGENPDSTNPRYSTKCGVYTEGIGLDSVHMSWGHDEYMYMVCKYNECKLPPQALAIIRYHSFYPWHQHGEYGHLTNEQDRENLKWIKEFQKFDLYSKLPEKPNPDVLLPYYEGLINKYFPKKVLDW